MSIFLKTLCEFVAKKMNPRKLHMLTYNERNRNVTLKYCNVTWMQYSFQYHNIQSSTRILSTLYLILNSMTVKTQQINLKKKTIILLNIWRCKHGFIYCRSNYSHALSLQGAIFAKDFVSLLTFEPWHQFFSLCW